MLFLSKHRPNGDDGENPNWVSLRVDRAQWNPPTRRRSATARRMRQPPPPIVTFATAAILAACPRSRVSRPEDTRAAPYTRERPDARHSGDSSPTANIVPQSADATVGSVHAQGTTAPGAGIPDAGVPWQGFLGGDDTAILRRICDGAIARYERNRGGSTISFRVWFDGGRGLFKPQQTNTVANFRAEIAAFRMSRLLGLHRVPPACGRTVPRAALQQSADASGDAPFSERVLHEVISRGDDVSGALIYWVPGPLENVPGTERHAALLDATRPIAPGDAELAADLSRLMLFDFLVNNVDRWSGGNILRQRLRDQPPGPMLIMDNGASFTVGADGFGSQPRAQDELLRSIGRFPRSLVAALRALTAERIAEEMSRDRMGRVLGETQIRAVLTRRDRIVQHIDEQIRARGENAVLVFP